MNDFTTRLDRTANRLLGEGWKYGQQDNNHYFTNGNTIVFIHPDGEVRSVDIAARMYVHCIFQPEMYGIPADSVR